MDDEDRRFFLGYLSYATTTHDLAIHAYVLMTNHVHVLATPAAPDSAPRSMHKLGSTYARYFNDKYKRTGTLWEGRYKAAIVHDEQYLFACMRYVELNPVRAQIAAHPGDYAWSSYPCNALGHRDNLVSHHALYLALGVLPEQRSSAYRELFGSALAGDVVARIREDTHRGWAIGDDHFCGSVEANSRRARPTARGRKVSLTPGRTLAN